MFKTRLLSGILLVIIALATIISGDYVLFFTLLAVSLIGMRELYRAMKVQDEKINLLALRQQISRSVSETILPGARSRRLRFYSSVFLSPCSLH